MLDGSVNMFIAHNSFLTGNSDQVKSLAMLTSERVFTASDLPYADVQGIGRMPVGAADDNTRRIGL